MALAKRTELIVTLMRSGWSKTARCGFAHSSHPRMAFLRLLSSRMLADRSAMGVEITAIQLQMRRNHQVNTERYKSNSRTPDQGDGDPIDRLMEGQLPRRNHAKSIQSKTKKVRDKLDKCSSDDVVEARIIEPEGEVYGELGEEISGKKIDKQEMMRKLNEFYQLDAIRQLATAHYMEDKLFSKAFISFRRYCFKSASLPPELHIKFCDIIDGYGHVSDLFPFFLKHAREVFPHLECYEELCKISDLGLPHQWYPQAREEARKIIFHCGPTNSGKTYGAMKRFLESSSGIYCGPLKLLAVEICNKANKNNTPCDLVTGEERRIANPDGVTKSSHVSCTVEMTSVTERVEVAVIDEIQMLRDPSRGWAWTRALLGVPADEVHICGEEAALDLIRNMLLPTADTLEVIRYKRLTELVIENEPLRDLANIRSGDCIVCFSKDALYSVSLALEKLGHKVAVVYGTLPPQTKQAQCARFNKLEDCQVMVATDAIGMGLNLSIGRIIFWSLIKLNNDAQGNLTLEYLTTSQCLQIAGRAGRFNSAHSTGYVTTYRPEDLPKMREIMAAGVEPIERAGLHPTSDQMELFAYNLPHLSLSNLIDLFVDLCKFDTDSYFICDLENFKLIADTIQHISVPLRARYLFCCAPIDAKKAVFVTAVFTKMVRLYSKGEQVTVEWLKYNVGWPPKEPKNLEQLSQLENMFDVCETYLWLSYRFPDIFCERDEVKHLQKELETVVSKGVSEILRLITSTRNKTDTKSEASVR